MATLLGLGWLPWLAAVLAAHAVDVEGGRGRGSPTTTTPAPPPLPGPLDLTLGLDSNATHLPSDQGFSITRNSSERSDRGWFSAQSMCGGGQAGTHIQAPFHLNEKGWKVDELPLARLLAPGILLDVSSNASRNANYVLTVEQLSAWEKKHGPPPEHSVLLINFGWGPRLRSHPNDTALPFPGISKEAAEHIVNQGRVVGVGVDLPSVDAGKARERPAARALLAANIYTLLNLDLTHDLPAKGFSMLVMPQKVRGAAAASTRVIATPRSPSRSGASERPAGASWQLAIVSLSGVLAASILQPRRQ